MSLVPVARVGKPRGVRGEVWIERYRDGFPDFPVGSEVWLSGDAEADPHRVASFFEYSKGCVLRLEGVGRPEEARGFQGLELFVPAGRVPKDGPDEFEAGEIAGWALVDLRRGTVGEVCGAVPGPAYWTFLAIGPSGKEIEVPAVKGYGVEFDRDRKVITVDLPDGYPGIDDED